MNGDSGMTHSEHPNSKARYATSVRRFMKARPNPKKAVAMAGSLVSGFAEDPYVGEVLIRTLIPQEGMLTYLAVFTVGADAEVQPELDISVDDGTGLTRAFLARVVSGRAVYDIMVPVQPCTRLRIAVTGASDAKPVAHELYVSLLYSPKPTPDNIVLVDITKENAIETLATVRAQGGSK